MITLIDNALLDKLSTEAHASARRRKNLNFHTSDAVPAHRLLNAIEPDSYVAPHRHVEPTKGETMILVRGTLGIVTFDDAGQILEACKLSPGGTGLGVDIPAGTWHAVLALEPGTVFFEAKAGPYVPLAAHEKAGWAPAEGDVEVPAYMARLRERLA